MKKKAIANVWLNDGLFAGLLNGRSFLADSLREVENADVLVLWGGEDINPALYGETNVRSYNTKQSERRDDLETRLFYHALGNIPIIGICRGAQLSCALLGGKLWQHVVGHTTDHMITLNPRAATAAKVDKITVTSTHHQMMRPSEEMEVIAVSSQNYSHNKINAHGSFETLEPEVEILYHPKNVLMIQGHPEYNHASHSFRDLTRKLCNEYLGI